MNNKKIFEKIITEKRAKSSNERPKYGLRKLTVGVVSCLLGYMMFFTPNVVAAEKVDQPQVVEAVESTEVNNGENVENEPEQPKEKPAEIAETAETEKPVPHVEAYSSNAKETNAQDRTVRTTAEKTSETETEGKTEQAKQADSYVPELEAIKVVKGQSVENYRKAFKNLPEDATIKVINKADTNEAGEKIATVEITFADQSRKQEIITVKVYKTQEDLDKEELDKTGFEMSTTGAENSKQQAGQPASEEFVEEKAKENWDKDVQDKSRWAVGKDQRLARVGTGDPIKMSDIDYDGVFEDAEGNTVIRLVYKERSASATGVWYRARFNFGELDQYIDYDKSYVVDLNTFGNEEGTLKLTPVNDRKEREFDLGVARHDPTDARLNLPINLVLKKGMTVADLANKNYTVQMRLTDADGKKIYAYAPGKTSMDYSTYTKTTSVAIEDNINNTFLKGGKQKDGNNATSQETFFSEFIANPKEYKDESQLGIIRTQYYGVRSGTAASPTVGGQQIGFTQVFDANLVKFLKADDDGNVAYVNLLTTAREVSPYAHRFGIKKEDINYTKDGKKAYIVIAPNAYQRPGDPDFKKVEVEKHDQYTMLNGFYISAIDYVVDKSKLAETFDKNKTRKLDYSMMSGWTNPNNEGWTVYEKKYDHEVVAEKGESFLINTNTMPEGGQIMIKIGDKDQALIRKQQGYYTYKVGPDLGNSIEKIEAITKDGVFKITLREGAKIEAGDTLKVYLPYSPNHDVPVGFFEVNNATTELDKGAATLTKQKDSYINMHLYTDLPKGASFKIKYTLKNGTDSSLIITKGGPLGGKWVYNDTDKVLTGAINTTTGKTGGNFYINPGQLKPGVDIVVEAYDQNGSLIEGKTSAVRYSNFDKIDPYKDLTWTDASDKLSILSINKSLYKPYQVIFTNDYVDNNTDDFYKDPHVMPTDNANFMTKTSKIQGYTKYDGGLIRMRTELINKVALLGKTQALSDVYDDKGNLTTDNSSKINLKDGEYRVYRYDIDLNALGTIGSTGTASRQAGEENTNSLELLKDKKLYFNASDGSSLPTELVVTRVRTRILFDTTEGQFADSSKKSVRIAPDNVKYLDDAGYVANGFTGDNVAAGTGDTFAENPTAQGKTFLGWVTEAGKTELGKTTTTSKAFNDLAADKKFTETTPITTHQVVYAVWSEGEKLVTFDANGGKFDDNSPTKTDDINDGVQAPTPTKEGKEFVGWASKPDATEVDVVVANLTEGQTVYAVWKDEATPAVDKKPLQAEVDKDAATKADVKYANASDEKKTAYDEALKKANEVLKDEKATQEQVNAAKKALEDAREALDGK
ncbi:InlB B-repeat-containing protein, partial [Finegoldia sp. P2-F-LR]